jgi:hypothetical protein
MNQAAKAILRVVAVAVGTYYVYGGLYLFEIVLTSAQPAWLVILVPSLGK